MKKNVGWLALVVAFATACSPKITATSTSDKIKISSVSPAIPMLKGLSTNPLLHLTIEVPAGSEITYRKVSGTLDASALHALQKIEIYFTDTLAQFSTNNLIGSVVPLSESFEIPASLPLKPGLHHVWLSATLKPSADIDKKIEVHATQLIDEAGKKHPIAEGSSSYTKRLGVAIRKAGDEGVNTYRIPGITMTDKRTLIAVYDIRYNNSRDLPGNIDVGMSRSVDGGKTWEPMKNIIDMGAPHENNGVGDPVVLFDPAAKKIWVAALWSKGNRSIAGSKPGLSPDTTGQFVLVSSSDDGITWSTPYSITEQVKNPAWHLYFNGPGNGIVMQNGTLVFPSQYWDESKMPHSSIIYSNDHGNTWKSGIGAKSNTTESQVVETTPGTLMLSMRDNRGKFRSIATTTDMGNNWAEHPTSYNTLPDPICMASLIKANVKIDNTPRDVLFFSNPESHDRARDSMTVKASTDLGATWPTRHRLLIDERVSYGYSVLVRIDENMLGLLYEGTKDLYLVRIPVAEIMK
jgi:sialidase-1